MDVDGRGRLTTLSAVFLSLFVFGAWIRSLDLWKPVDGRIRESWRECDYAAVARNFYREGMDIRYPRIDWRGDGPGFAEMEFPVVPWTMAALYRIFGYHEIIGRILVYAFSLMALLVFFALARRLLPPAGAVAAGLVFVLNPLAVRVSNSLQPEGPMLFFCLAAVYAFLRWLESDRWSWYGKALFATAAAVLVKIPALHLGIFFALLLLADRGLKSLQSAKVWAFGALALLPALLWYAHAHRLWLTYGNSLGVSNEYHWLGWDLVKNLPLFLKYLLRLAKREVTFVWMPLGWVAALAVFWYRKKEKDRTVKVAFYWLLAVGLYYLVTLRTSADSWASYYHVSTVPAAALLFGAGASLLLERAGERGRLAGSLGISAFLSFILVAGTAFYGLSYEWPIFSVALGLAFSIIAAVPLLPARHRLRISGFSVALCLLTVFPFQALQVGRDLHPRQFLGKYACARLFQPLIPQGTLILAAGSVSRDDTGRPVAFNAPYMFFWLDRKGFNIPSDELSIEHVQDFVRRGARFFVLEKDALKANPSFKENMEKRFVLLAECAEAFLFKF